jgi:hypothetical protein
MSNGGSETSTVGLPDSHPYADDRTNEPYGHRGGEPSSWDFLAGLAAEAWESIKDAWDDFWNDDEEKKEEEGSPSP